MRVYGDTLIVGVDAGYLFQSRRLVFGNRKFFGRLDDVYQIMFDGFALFLTRLRRADIQPFIYGDGIRRNDLGIKKLCYLPCVSGSSAGAVHV